MPDPTTGGPLGFFFPSLFGNVPAAQSYEALQARRKIAEAMMARQTKMPRNVGEGLTAIGDAIGDRNYYNRVLADDEDAKSYEGTRTAALPPQPSTYRPYSPGGDDSDSIAPAATRPPMPLPVTPAARAVAPQQTVPVPNETVPAGTPLPPDQQQDPDSPVIRMPTPQAMQDWRNSVQIPPLTPPRPQPPGPRSDAAPSPTGAANIPPLASAYQQPPGVQTAALQGGTATDAPDPAASAVRDQIAQAQLAQNNVFPPVASDASKAVMPGGFQPPGAPPAAPQVRAAPPQPQIQKAPDVPEVPPLGPKPAPPQLMPTENARTQHFESIAADPRLSPQARQQASTLAATERAQINSFNAQKIQEYNEYLKPWIDAEQKRKDPQTIFATEKARRELQSEVPRPLTPQERQGYGIPEGQAASMTRDGKIQYGPAGTHVTVDTGAKAQGKGDERLQEKLSEHFIKTFEEGNTAGDDVKQIAEMRALAARVGTGAGAAMKQYLGTWGIKSQGLDEIQALQAGISRLIPAQRVPGSGTSSDFDAENFKNAVVSLNKTAGGNALIFDTMDGLAKNKLARSDVAGRVISGDITRQDGIKEMLTLQRQAKELSDKVKAYTDASGAKPPPAPAIPSDDTMRNWLRDNPNHPRADAVRKSLGM